MEWGPRKQREIPPVLPPMMVSLKHVGPSRKIFLSGSLAYNRTNFKEIFSICNYILGRNNDLPLPLSDSNINLANNFNNYFYDKIDNIYSSLVQHNQATSEIYGVKDAILTSLLKRILPSVSQLLTAIVNSSTTLGTFPTLFKGALVQPLLKKAYLDLVNKNYRPVLIKCIVADQVTSHIAQPNLMEANQSTYHSHHSTGITLLRVKADILWAMDN